MASAPHVRALGAGSGGVVAMSPAPRVLPDEENHERDGAVPGVPGPTSAFGRALGAVPCRWWYPVAGALLAAGAPAGLLLLEAMVARAWPGPSFVLAAVRREPLTYAYLLLSTTVVFVLLGAVLGRLVDELAARSTTDVLTGLSNRRAFDARLAEELARAARHGTPLALVALDVDGLKAINDRGGHAAGDAAIRAVAEALRSTARATDLAARTGGDELAVLAPLTTGEQALALAERIRLVLRRVPGAPTVSIGVADLARAGPRTLGATADAALYRAKAAGRDRVILA